VQNSGIKFRKIYHQHKLDNEAEQITDSATIDDLANILSAIHHTQREEAGKLKDSIQSIESALTGEGETTVVTQMQKLRTMIADKNDELIKSFNDFARDMAENNSKALIEALENVIRDFNAKINEQFGENFKQLNEAVGRILIWQEQYKEQMDEMARVFQNAAESIDESKDSLEIIAQHSSAISDNAQKLEPIMTAMERQLISLEEHLKAFSDLKERAEEAFPIIENRIQKLTSTFSENVNQAITLSNETVNNLSKSLQTQADFLSSSLTETKSNIESITAQTASSIDQMFQEASNRIENQLTNLDNELSAELTKALESLGSQLASLSTKFVNDYSPLTDKLRDVVQLSKDIKYGH